MSKPAESHRAPDHLSNRKAGGLLLAFLTVVFLVALATMLAPTERPSVDEPVGSSQPWLLDSITDTSQVRHA